MCWRSLLCSCLMVLAIAIVAQAEDTTPRKQDEQAIRATAKAYQAALAKGDAKALAEFWTKDGCLSTT